MTLDDLKVRLEELPETFNGLLFVQRGVLDLETLRNLRTKANVQIVICHDINGIKLSPFTPNSGGKHGKDQTG